MLQRLVCSISELSICSDKKAEILGICDMLGEEIESLRSKIERDVLGDWFNRRGLFSQAEIIFSAYQRGAYPYVSVGFIDLDRFKTINDVYGHAHGDEVIVAVADVIRQSVRRSDVYGRLGGDEFVIVLPGASKRSARSILARIKKKFCSRIFEFNRYDIPVSLTFGVMSTGSDGESFEILLHKADEEMNMSKENRSRQ